MHVLILKESTENRKNSISDSMFITIINENIIKAFTKMFWGQRFLLTKNNFRIFLIFKVHIFFLHNFS